jgi:hypothetical protein
MKKELRGTADYNAARIVLITMRVALREHTVVASNQVEIQPSTQILSDAAAAEVLAKAPKPLRCNGSQKEGHLLVGYTRLTPDDIGLYNYRMAAMEQSGGILGVAGLDELRDLSDPHILLQGGEERLLLTIEELEIFQRGYLVTPPYSLAAGPPDEQLREQGVDWVVHVSGPPKPLDISDIEALPGPERSIIRSMYDGSQMSDGNPSSGSA